MKLLKLFIPATIAILLGYGLGCIPGLNEHLHWNIGMIIPFSGLVFGSWSSSIMFLICYSLNIKIGRWQNALLALAAVMGYAVIDYGIYISTNIPVSNSNALQNGIYPLHNLITFLQYMKVRLGSSSISDIGLGTTLLKMGIYETTTLYIADFVGVILGALLTIWYYVRRYPYCARCQKFKERAVNFELFLDGAGNLAENILSEINNLIKQGKHNNVIDRFTQLSEQYNSNKGNVKITIDQRQCPMCKEVSFVGTVYLLKGSNWVEEKKLGFFMDSQPQSAQIQPSV